MILTAEQRYKAEHGMDVDSSGGKRGSSKYRLWPGGVVVYTIESRLGKFSQILIINPRTYKQSHTPTRVQMASTPHWVFDILQYFEKDFTLMESL